MRKKKRKKKRIILRLFFQLTMQTMGKGPDDHSRSSGKISFDDRA